MQAEILEELAKQEADFPDPVDAKQPVEQAPVEASGDAGGNAA